MSTNTCCAVNEVLLCLMAKCIKMECVSMHNAGATTEQINAALAEHIIPYYEAWRRTTLERAMAQMEGMTPTPEHRAPLTPLRLH